MSAPHNSQSPELVQALAKAKELDNEISRTMCRAAAVLRLAAFACEARRVLEEIDFRTQHLKDFRKVLDGIHQWRQWSCIEEDPAQVLCDLADVLGGFGYRLDNEGGPAFLVAQALEAGHA